VTPKAAQTITFNNPGSQNFGTTPTLSATASSGLSVAFTSATTSVCTVSGSTLTFLTTGNCTVNADQAGNGTYNAATQVTQSFTVASTVPGIPANVVATVDANGVVTISVTDPVSDGGSPIDYYFAGVYPTVQNSGPAVGPSIFSRTGTVSSIFRSSYPKGVQYSVIVRAHNANGDGAFSTPITFIVQTAPDAPTSVTATPGSGSANVAFSAPASDGGAAITSYTVTASPGGATASGTSSPINVSGLTNGTAYTFTVKATNSKGTSVSSGASTSVTPKAAQTITFNNPGSQNFGTTPTLSATASSGLSVAFTSATTSVCTVSGNTLTFLTTGNCTINADQAGNSTYNAATQVAQTFAVAAVVPGAPSSVNATAGNGSASVSFAAPVTSGGAAITGYTVTASPGGITASGASSPINVTGLTNGTAYHLP
jgi:hypothetical protein